MTDSIPITSPDSLGVDLLKKMLDDGMFSGTDMAELEARRAALESRRDVYEARPIKLRRRRATKNEMGVRREMIVDLAIEHGPCSVRHVFYQAVVAGVPGVTKDDRGYAKVQRLVLEQRRTGAIPYQMIVDSTRWMRKPTTWGSVEEALEHTARFYRRALWRTSPWRVEVWCESDSIASTIVDITGRWDVPLMVCRGYSSETFAYNAAEAWRESDKHPVVLYVGDHDPAGLSIEARLRETLTGFMGGYAPTWTRVGVTWEQIEELELPGTRPKKSYGYPIAVEAEALPPVVLRDLIDEEILAYVDHEQLDVLRAAEDSERDLLLSIASGGAS